MDLVERLAGLIEVRRASKPRYAVGIDGPDAAGKSTLAGRLTRALAPTVVHASIDGFHHPRAVRHAPDRITGEAFYRRTFDVDAFRTELLEPFRSGGGSVRTAKLDYDTDRAIEPRVDVPDAAVLVADGVFLQQPALREHWDLVVYLDISPELSRDRGIPRDVSDRRSVDTLAIEYEQRYLPGQQLYRTECDPTDGADILIDNTDLDAPRLIRYPPLPR